MSVPLRDEMGSLLCPRCHSPLSKGKADFKIHGEYVGKFESFVCPICDYSALTAMGYKEALAEALKFGLVGPAEERVEIEILQKAPVPPAPQISRTNETRPDQFPFKFLAKDMKQNVQANGTIVAELQSSDPQVSGLPSILAVSTKQTTITGHIVEQN